MSDEDAGNNLPNKTANADGNDWSDRVTAVKARETAVLDVAGFLTESQIKAAKEISSTDLFVQKAESDLGERSKKMMTYAKYCIFQFLFGIAIFVFIYWLSYCFFKINFTNTKIANQILIAGIAKNATFIGIFLGHQYLVVSLYRAFLHESTTLQNRIHSLRLGRLFVYLKFASTSEYDIAKVRDSISASDLEKAFGWNIETSTAFKDINPEVVSKSIWSNIPELIGAVRGKTK